MIDQADSLRVLCDAVNGFAPVYATPGAAGADLKAYLSEPLVIDAWSRARVPTGVRLEFPIGFEGQVRPRSGLAARQGVTVLNAPGTIDSDYRGEIQVILVNLSDEPARIEPGEQIAQLIVAPVSRAVFEVGPLSPTARGDGGFGSTGS